MELEVSQKVRAAIKAKLVELGVHVDEELPDYIMVLIANRRSPSQMESDLNLFLGEQTHRFVGWLTHVLKKLEEVTAGQPATTTTTTAKKRKSSTGTAPPPPEQSVPSGSPQKKEAEAEPSKKKKREKKAEKTPQPPAESSQKKQKTQPEKRSSPPPPPEERAPPPKQATPPPPPPPPAEKQKSHHRSRSPQKSRPRQISPMRRSRSRSPAKRRRSRSPPSQSSTSPRKHPLSRTPPRRSRSPVSLQRRETYKARSSVFERLLNRRRGSPERISPPVRSRRSRSKSNSPPRKLLSSVVVRKKIESIIKSNNDAPPKVASAVVKVEAPKTRAIVDKPSKLLLKAVSEANADVYKHGDGASKVQVDRKVERKLEETKKSPTKTLLPAAASLPRKPVHERLGKRVVTSIHERIGSRGADRQYFHENISITVEHEKYEPEEYVEEYDPEEPPALPYAHNEDSSEPVFGEASLSPGSLALHAADGDSLPIPRISIALHSDEDTTDEEEEEDKSEHSPHSSPHTPSSPQRVSREEEEEEELIVLQENSPIRLEDPAEEVAVAAEQNSEPTAQQQQTASDLREKLVKRHNAKKQEAKKEAESKAEATAKQAVPQQQQTPQPPPTVVLPKPAPAPLVIAPLSSSNAPIPCKFGTGCKNPACRFKHPPVGIVYCKFDLACKNPSCRFKHSFKPGVSGGNSAVIPAPAAGTCKWILKFGVCKDVQCSFYHPSQCKFSSACTNAQCKFLHPDRASKFPGSSASALPQRNLLKWEKKTV